jgi:hypothetical protein
MTTLSSTHRVDAVQEGLKDVNEAAAITHKAHLEALTLAIRDIWASETVDNAKAIVKVFVKQ